MSAETGADQGVDVLAGSSKELPEAIVRTRDRLSEETRSELPLEQVRTLVEEAGWRHLGPPAPVALRANRTIVDI